MDASQTSSFTVFRLQQDLCGPLLAARKNILKALWRQTRAYGKYILPGLVAATRVPQRSGYALQTSPARSSHRFAPGCLRRR
jgi:hypothetical protein